MTEHISDEYFVTREVVTYNGSALVSGEKDLVVEECYQLVVNGRGAGEITCSPWDKKEAFLGYLYLRGYISGAGDVAPSMWMRNMEWFWSSLKSKVTESRYGPKASIVKDIGFI